MALFITTVVALGAAGCADSANIATVERAGRVTYYPTATVRAEPTPVLTETPVPPAPPIPTPAPTPTSTPLILATKSLSTTRPAKTAQQWISVMTLEQKVGQLFIIVPEGQTLGPETRRQLRYLNAGGVVLLEKNVSAPLQTAEFIQAMQLEVRAAGLPGMLVAADQEGGQVSRLRRADGYTEFPSPMALAATPGGCESVRVAAAIVAREMKAIGMNTVLAPVLDINNNPENPVINVRAFGSEPGQVARCGIAHIDAVLGEGLIAVGKHFPGHGDTSLDSHTALPVITHTLERLNSVEFVPFKAAIQAGIPAIMTAHIVFPALDPTPNLPSTLSQRVLSGLLRKELNFKGAIFSDALTMGALPLSGNPGPQATVKALKAGADVLLFGEGYQAHRDAYEAVISAVRAGDVSAERLDDAVRRVLKLKEDFGLLEAPSYDAVKIKLEVGSAAHLEIAARLARESITIVRDNQQLLPALARATAAQVLLIENEYAISSLPARIEISGTRLMVGLDPTPADISQSLKLSEGDKLVILTTSNLQRNSQRPLLLKALLEAKRRVIVVALAAPYDLLYAPQASTYVAIYGVNPATLEALKGVLTAPSTARGRLPVDLPGLYPIGHRWLP